MPIARSVFRSRALPVVSVGATSGIEFPLNNTANNDIRSVLSGANLLSRTSHTIIRKVRYKQQAGYYAWGWFSRNNNETDFDGTWEWGAHPYPATGTVDAQGRSTGGTGGSGEVHYHEIASLGSLDWLASPGGSAVLVTKGIWYTQALKCEVVSGNVCRHTCYLDLENNPSQVIVQDYELATIVPGANSVFYIGASDWRRGQGGAGSDSNDESPGCITRFHKFFSAPMTLADIQTEAAAETNIPQTGAGIASIWYSNINPTPSDVTDKSGQGHHPNWANANRPTLWTP